MPLTPNFTASQIIGLPNEIVFLDTSLGSDVAITARRIDLQKSNSTYLVPSGTSTSYIAWALADTTVTEDVLTTDTALSIKVDWIDVSGTVLYTKTILYVFTLYNEEFDYSLTSLEASNENSISNTNWYNSRIKLRVEIDNAKQAVSLGDDITNAQSSCDRATFLRLNQSMFY